MKKTVYSLRIAAWVLLLAFVGTASKTFAASADSPRIVVEGQGNVVAVDHAPARIAVHFEPAQGATIDLSSFQVLYQLGIFRKDITARVLQYVTLTPAGLTGFAPADLPEGTHTLIIRIRDSQRRMAEQALTFSVTHADSQGA
ncbi:MAG TPA: hypothetical protein VK437_15385 [Steroidobacteraceae bacterium]|nr:hypothetical protein [Steroidobacteraceae bacterium]